MDSRKRFLVLALTAAMYPGAISSHAQSATSQTVTPLAASAPTAVPALVPYSGIVIGDPGKALPAEIDASFQIYKEEQGGEPLWTETQTVNMDPGGHYKVQLGATSPTGLPYDLFSSGEARWLEVQVAGQPPQPRLLLASVPYAFKSSDATTLGGLPASAFVLAGTRSPENAATIAREETLADASSTVTTSGGTPGYLPMFTGTATVADSIVFQNTLGIGIGDVPNAALDVNGKAIFRGAFQVARIGDATKTAGVNSNLFSFFAQVYDSAKSETIGPSFSLRSEAIGNNTASPGATLNLLYDSGLEGSNAETGFYFNANGTMHFASGQTFPGGGGTITGVTAGSGLTGGGTGGTVTLAVDTTKIPTLTDNPTFTGTTSFNSTKAGNPAVMATGTSGSTGLEGSSSTGYGVYGVSGYNVGVVGMSSLGEGVLGSSVSGYGTVGQSQSNDGIFGSSGSGYGVVGASGTGTAIAAEATTGNGLYAYATTGSAAYLESSPPDKASLYVFNNSTANTFPQAIYASASGTRGIGVSAYATAGIGVLGVGFGGSQTFQVYGTNGNVAGVWGDTSGDYATSLAGLAGTADNNHAGVFINNSNIAETLLIGNSGSGGTGLFRTLEASTSDGTCGFGGKGDMACTGQVKTLATTSTAHTVETYAMQSPENWMEDFGSGMLRNGVATVAIDPAFAETVNTSGDYHVFLTPNGDSKGLYVTARTATSFEVRESSGGASSLTFDYRIVAKRRGYETERLTDVTERFEAEMERTSLHLRAAAAGDSIQRSIQPYMKPPMRPALRPTVLTARPLEIRPWSNAAGTTSGVSEKTN